MACILRKDKAKIAYTPTLLYENGLPPRPLHHDFWGSLVVDGESGTRLPWHQLLGCTITPLPAFGTSGRAASPEGLGTSCFVKKWEVIFQGLPETLEGVLRARVVVFR